MVQLDELSGHMRDKGLQGSVDNIGTKTTSVGLLYSSGILLDLRFAYEGSYAELAIVYGVDFGAPHRQSHCRHKQQN